VIETEMVELDDSYCRFYPYVGPGRYAVVSVSDTGVGMDAETRERIFEPSSPQRNAARNRNGLGYRLRHCETARRFHPRL